MSRTAAQIEASKKNGSLSRGPTSNQGKLISRMNSTIHGFTSKILIPVEEAQALEQKIAAFEDALKPQDAVQMELVKRFTLATIRLDRIAIHDASATKFRMRNAASKFDDEKMAEVDHLISWIAHEPVTNNRRLKRSRLGTSRLIKQIEALRSDLMRQPNYLWTYQHCDQLHHYLGMRREEMPITRIRALTEAIHGKFENLDPMEIPESETLAKRRWAIRELAHLLDDEIASLKAHLETLAPDTMDIDRAEAADRSLFDESNEGVLVRKYEAACERSMYKALKELKAMQTEAAQVEPEQEALPESPESLGSFFLTSSADEDMEAMIDPTTPTDDLPATQRRPDLEKLAKKGRRRSKSA